MTAVEIVGLEWLGSLAIFLAFILLIRYLDHRERMAMIARGLMPERLLNPVRRVGSAALRGGLITAMVGVAVTLALYALGYLLPSPFSAVPGKLGPWLLPGLIPLGVGAALVASHYLAPPPTSARARDEAPSASGTPPLDDEASDPRERVISWRLFGRVHPRLVEPSDTETERTEHNV
ncbi:MAG TPA: DUF6249 domain-containing protein [Ktedonobacterales bacterium]|nr:DUF6249 domain-containing protein [Ktedonobacterales bacterium]